VVGPDAGVDLSNWAFLMPVRVLFLERLRFTVLGDGESDAVDECSLAALLWTEQVANLRELMACRRSPPADSVIADTSSALFNASFFNMQQMQGGNLELTGMRCINRARDDLLNVGIVLMPF